MSKDIQKKYIENQPVYVKTLFKSFFNEENIKKLYKIFVTYSIEECSNKLSYIEKSKLFYRGFDSYSLKLMNEKLANINDYLQFLSKLDETTIFKYCYIHQNTKSNDVKNGCYTYLKKIFTELCIILEIENKTPILLL
jgi:hypothetical protein